MCVRLCVSVPITIIILRPFVWSDHQMKRISGGQTSLGARCHAPIKSRRRSLGGGGRQELSQSDQPVDGWIETQPAATRNDDSDVGFRANDGATPKRTMDRPMDRLQRPSHHGVGIRLAGAARAAHQLRDLALTGRRSPVVDQPERVRRQPRPQPLVGVAQTALRVVLAAQRSRHRGQTAQTTDRLAHAHARER